MLKISGCANVNVHVQYRLTCLVSPLHGSSGPDNAAPPFEPWTDTPERISSGHLHSEWTRKRFKDLPAPLSDNSTFKVVKMIVMKSLQSVRLCLNSNSFKM